MALWGNNDNVGSAGTVWLNYSTGIVTATGTSFGNVGSAQTGDVIRFGERSGTYYGDAVIISVDSTTQVTIGSTVGLSGASIAGVEFTISQLPKFTILDSHYSEASYGTEDSFVYGVGRTGTDAAQETKYQLSHAGWVGVTTYNDQHGEMRVKSETLVAMSGIQTGNAPAYPGDAA